MKGVAKAILMTILLSAAIVTLTNLAFFFPWYITMVTETFNVSQVVAADNYLKQTYHDDAMNRLISRPMYAKKSSTVDIEVFNADGADAVGDDDATVYYSLSEYAKPYRQRGEPLTVTITAEYPFEIELWGNTLERSVLVSYSMSTTGLKLYKDLDYGY